MADSWQGKALCKGATDLFFPPRGKNLDDIKAVCHQCPVMMECRESGMQEKFGVGVRGPNGSAAGFAVSNFWQLSRAKIHDHPSVTVTHEAVWRYDHRGQSLQALRDPRRHGLFDSRRVSPASEGQGGDSG